LHDGFDGSMTDEQVKRPAAGAGALLEAARRKQGLHIAALAAQLKVLPSRLEAIEAERWAELPDTTHARALATSMCRVLGMDPAPVLAGMPRSALAGLERVTGGLNEPVRTHEAWSGPARWALMGGLLLVVIALTVFYWPSGPRHVDAAQEALAMPPASEVAALPPASESLVGGGEVAPNVTVLAAAAPSAVSASLPGSSAAPRSGALLEIRAERGASWVGVTDAGGKSLAGQLLNVGDVLQLDPAGPVRVTLGNAPVLALTWRGQTQSLEAFAVTRVGKLELK
jgi:cytoskeleton protein RodZ